MSRSLLARLTALCLLIGAVVGTIGIAFLHSSAQRVLRTQSLDREGQIAARLAALLDSETAAAAGSLRVMAANAAVAQLSPAVGNELVVYLRVAHEFDTVELVDARGQPRAAAATHSLVNVAALLPRPDLVSEAATRDPVVTTLLLDRPEVEIAVPVENPPGTQVGVLFGTVNVASLAAPVEALHLGSGGFAFITDRSGRIIAHPNLNLVVAHATFPVGNMLGAASSAKRVKSELAGVAAAEVYPGDVVVEEPEGEALAFAGHNISQFSIIIGLVVVAIVLGVVISARALLLGLAPLAAAARRFGRGDFTTRVATKGPAEIGLLAAEFNQMADRLSEAFERERAVFETANDAIFEIGHDRRIERLNPAFSQLFGWDRDEWIGRPFMDLVHPEDRSNADDDLSTTDPANFPVHREIRVPTPAGDYRPVDVIAVPRTSGGRVTGLLGIARDMTERKQAEDALRRSEHAYAAAFEREREAADRLRELDRLKDEFLGTVSHELRTPLTVIIGFAVELAAHGNDLDEELRADLLMRVHRHGTEMHSLVEQLLDFSLLEAGKSAVDPHPVALEPAVGACLERLGPALAHHQVAVEIPTGLEVVADENALNRILGNLVGNAAKYAPSGTRITVHANPEGDGVHVSVIDEGPGIPAAYRTQVFERFHRGSGRPPAQRGAGIGLSIVQRYVGLLGGRVWVEDGPGGGSSFSFTLPGVREEVA